MLLGGIHAAAEESRYDEAFDAVMTHYRLPGLAVGVIEDGTIVYRRTAGERIAGSGDEIGPDTLFKIASNSKAMTASVLARQVDAGELDWDDPVIEHLPSFRMYDDWVTQNLQVQDLLIHNSGLPAGAGDLMFWPEPNSFTRADVLAGLAHLEPEYGFRSGYAYDNTLYIVAGEVAAAAGGASYEELVRREIFEPLELGCKVGEWRREADDDIAQPHIRVDERNVVALEDGDVIPAITMAAAGGIRCSLNDMLAWAGNWLDPSPAQREWLSEEQRRALWTPRTPMPVPDLARRWNGTHFYAYAYGFRLADVDGEWTVSHTGSLMGMYSVMFLLPDRKSGFVMLTNGEGSDARTILSLLLTKAFTAPDDTHDAAWYIADLERDRAAPDEPKAPDTSARDPVTPEEMQAFTGVWRDAWFGDVLVCAEGSRVKFSAVKSPMLTGTVMAVDGRKLVDWDDVSVSDEAWLDFAVGHDGTAAALAMSKVDPEADFSSDYEDLAFTKVADCPMN